MNDGANAPNWEFDMRRDRLIFDAYHLGPISRAIVELEPLTVFVGPSNTGKSYMATMIYSVMRQLRSCLSQLERNQDTAPLSEEPNIEPKYRETLKKALKIFKGGSADKRHRELHRLLKERINSTLRNEGSMLSELLKNYGAESHQDLIQRGSQRMSVKTKVVNESGEKMFYSGFELSGKPAIIQRIRNVISDTAHKSELYLNEEYDDLFKSSPIFNLQTDDEDEAIFHMSNLVNDLCCLYIRNRIPEVYKGVHYLPAARSMLAQLTAFADHHASENVTKLESEGPSAQRMTGMAVDFLKNINYIRSKGNRSVKWEAGDRIASQIEDRILKGKIVFSEETSPLSQIRFAPLGWDSDMPIGMASSMVADLAPIALYFRYFLEPGDLLILEEPEAHLYPAGQKALVKEISEAIKRGVWVLLTTNSDWIISEIEAMISLSRFAEKHLLIRGQQLFPIQGADVNVLLFQEYLKDSGLSNLTEIDIAFMDEIGFHELRVLTGDEISIAQMNREEMEEQKRKERGE